MRAIIVFPLRQFVPASPSGPAPYYESIDFTCPSPQTLLALRHHVGPLADHERRARFGCARRQLGDSSQEYVMLSISHVFFSRSTAPRVY